MLFWHVSRVTSGVSGISKRHRGKPRENPSNTNNGEPAKLHDIQKLVGHVAALSRFVARLGEKALPFYALMKKSDDRFEWTEEANIAFAQLKKYFRHHQSWSHLEKKNHYYYISQPHIKW
jgi:hypothetical protein